MNDFQHDSVQVMYGKGSKIKVHSMSHNISKNTLLFELVVILGERIDEEVLEKDFADALVKDAIKYFFTEQNIKTIIRYDV